MEIIFEETVQFTSNTGYIMNWEEYGCKVGIKKGSIRDGETGELHIYGIYSGPFHVPKDIKLVSSIYYISLSHELLKPATLEIQHCCVRSNIYDSNGKCNLSFVSAFTTTSGAPYQFEVIQGGHFTNGGDYGIIQRRGFSGYAVAFVNWVKSFFVKSPFTEDPPQEKRIKLDSSTQSEPTEATSSHLRYGMYYFLIATTTDHKAYVAKLILTNYINSIEKYYKKKQERLFLSKIVKDKFEEVKLTSNELIIDVSREEQNSGLLEWQGHTIKIKGDWELTSESTGNRLKLLVDKIAEGLAPSLDIEIYWTGDSRPPSRTTFRIHYLGIQEIYSFPVTVPVLLGRFSSSVSSVYSSFEEDPDDDRISNPPSMKQFLTKVAPKCQGDCDEIAMHLLQDDTYQAYKNDTRGSKNNQRYECLFEMWKKETDDNKFTWDNIIYVLKKTSINKRLAKDLQNKLI